MKRATCLILLAILLSTSAVPSFAQYRKPPSEMEDEELSALRREKLDLITTYTQRTRSKLSAFIGQDISLGLDGLALARRYYPNLLAAAQERLNKALCDPMLMPKSAKADDGPRAHNNPVSDGVTLAWSIVSFFDDLMKNELKRDLADIYRDREQYPDERLEALAEEFSDQAMEDLADYMRAEAQGGSSHLTLLLLWIEVNLVWQNRIRFRRTLLPRPAAGGFAPVGQPGPQGWILGKPGGNGSDRNGSGSRDVPNPNESLCVEQTENPDGSITVTLVPCKNK